ncbi:response regulator transcription factor [uncultured Clostridium sp.]|uniref:response regulator transcription factor n=1 Tax=uncultured Clostridium sp. TaxID=59620 RepID=UPI002608B674|nr:response regulator transcription factor [uncultured Clostridium sp.]
MNILIADDEIMLTNILKIYFEKEGYKVFIANDGEEALNIFYNEKIDLAILDWMMPKKDGIELCKEFKELKETKVIILTAKGELDDEYVSLDAGADDYIRKPFDQRILLLRAKKLIEKDKRTFLRDLEIDFKGKKVFRNKKDLELTKIEFNLLEYFYNNKGKILSRDMLLNTVWGLDYYGDYRTVDTHIHRLREKIGNDYIKTHRGLGYCLHV